MQATASWECPHRLLEKRHRQGPRMVGMAWTSEAEMKGLSGWQGQDEQRQSGGRALDMHGNWE